ncbi:hypothetical protein GCM10010365_75660 [Streptomyces poonensis]|uniref:Uncharacterized protein n=1 Tax=Streptomyces poonensis TaxID=68255 RepID=A0A918QEA4_9ACTN|nr:hypothetical protein GCM10010365_75660 [Streptomyces poonensis]
MVQHRVRDPPELQSEVPGAAPGPDDQEAGVMGGVHQHPARGPFDGTPPHHRVRRNVTERRLQHPSGPLLMQPGRTADEQGLIGGLVRRAAPGPAQGGLASRPADRPQTGLGPVDADDQRHFRHDVSSR